MKKQVLVPIWSFPKATLPQSSQPGVLAISQTMGDILESIKIQVVLLPWVCNSFWAQLHYYFLHDLMEGLHSSSRFSSITPSTKNQIFWNLTRTYCLYIPFYHTGLKESNKMHLLSSSCKNSTGATGAAKQCEQSYCPQWIYTYTWSQYINMTFFIKPKLWMMRQDDTKGARPVQTWFMIEELFYRWRGGRHNSCLTIQARYMGRQMQPGWHEV